MWQAAEKYGRKLYVTGNLRPTVASQASTFFNHMNNFLTKSFSTQNIFQILEVDQNLWIIQEWFSKDSRLMKYFVGQSSLANPEITTMDVI